MKRTRGLSAVVCGWLVIASVGWSQESETAVHLLLEKSTSPSGPWGIVPPVDLPESGDGGMIDLADGNGAFYRLEIQLAPEGSDVFGVPLSRVASEALEIAKSHLESMRSEEPVWANAVLGEVAVPVYNPVVAEGKMPAWYEFQVRLSPQPEPPDLPAFPLSAPLELSPELGYILVTVGRHDMPIPQYATSGTSPCRRLRYLAQNAAIHIVRYDCNFWVAEDNAGRILATLGTTPYRIPAEILPWAGQAPAGEVLDNKPWQNDPKPDLKPAAYQDYEDFRADYTKGPVYTWLHQAKAKVAALDWAAFEDKSPPVLQAPLLEETLLLGDVQVYAFDIEDYAVQAWIEPKGGLWVTGSMDVSTVLTVVDTDLNVDYYILIMGKPIESFGWTSWTTDYGSSCAEMPKYTQEWDLSGCCNNGYSGCGPTAWAIFYGYWDRRAAPRLIGGTGTTPNSNTDDVRHCIRRTFDLVNCWCTSVSGQAATNPWDMWEGWPYAVERGHGITLGYNWSLPYTSSRPRGRGVDAIRSGRPAIVGTGYLSHYPMAYGYKYRRYRWGGITWDTQRKWKVYQGWGGNSCEWVDARSCWFGMNGYCQ